MIEENGNQWLDKGLLIEKIRQLPPDKISEVHDFVEFLNQKGRIWRISVPPINWRNLPSPTFGTNRKTTLCPALNFGDEVREKWLTFQL